MSFRIVSAQFGYRMFAAPQLSPAWTDRQDESAVYGADDSPETKLSYWRGYAASCGLDPACVQVVAC